MFKLKINCPYCFTNSLITPANYKNQQLNNQSKYDSTRMYRKEIEENGKYIEELFWVGECNACNSIILVNETKKKIIPKSSFL